jgi:biopolymer transport protein TolR
MNWKKSLMHNRVFLKRLRKKNKSINQINVTPFVDVMLVLLIVFMITAPLLKVGVVIDLPEAKAPSLSQKGDPIIVTVTDKDQIFIQDRITELNQLEARLKAITSGNKNLTILVQQDKTVNAELFLPIVARIKNIGFERVQLVGKPSGR